MGALPYARNRSIDSLWEVNGKTIEALEATLGLTIGSDDGKILYIQDVGTKEVGRGYIDVPTKKIYRCIVRTGETVNSTSKFEDLSVNSINDKLQNLESNKSSKAIGGNLSIYNGKLFIVWNIIDSILAISINHNDGTNGNFELKNGDVILDMTHDIPGYDPIYSYELHCGQMYGSGDTSLPFKLRVDKTSKRIIYFGPTVVIYGGKSYASLTMTVCKI